MFIRYVAAPDGGVIVTGPCTVATSGAEPRMLRALFRAQKLTGHETREMLFRESERADSAFLIVSGTVALYRMLANGRRIIARFLFAQDLVGLSFDDEYPYTAECLTCVRVHKLRLSQLKSLCAHSPDLQNEIVLLLKCELAAEREEHLPLMHHSADARLARLLFTIASRQGALLRNGQDVRIPMSRGDLADFLGLSLETVCRSFTKLRDGNLIYAPSPDQFRFEDVDGLRMLASGDETTSAR